VRSVEPSFEEVTHNVRSLVVIVLGIGIGGGCGEPNLLVVAVVVVVGALVRFCKAASRGSLACS
jgi:hypothetical protein